MKEFVKVNSVKELLLLVDIGMTYYTVMVAPGINYNIIILKGEESEYLVTSFGHGQILSKTALETNPDYVLGYISKGNLYVPMPIFDIDCKSI